MIYGPDGRKVPASHFAPSNEAGKQEAVSSKPLLPMVEIARSYSFKLQCERYNPTLKYESRDFFASQKTQCSLEDAEAVAAALHAFCKREVLKAVAECISELRAQAEAGWEQPTRRRTA